MIKNANAPQVMLAETKKTMHSHCHQVQLQPTKAAGRWIIIFGGNLEPDRRYLFFSMLLTPIRPLCFSTSALEMRPDARKVPPCARVSDESNCCEFAKTIYAFSIFREYRDHYLRASKRTAPFVCLQQLVHQFAFRTGKFDCIRHTRLVSI